jgi:hypothetical protein
MRNVDESNGDEVVEKLKDAKKVEVKEIFQSLLGYYMLLYRLVFLAQSLCNRFAMIAANSLHKRFAIAALLPRYRCQFARCTKLYIRNRSKYVIAARELHNNSQSQSNRCAIAARSLSSASQSRRNRLYS